MLAVAAAAGCSGGGPIVPEPPALDMFRTKPEANSEDEARLVFAKVLARYATCHNYRDRGVVTSGGWNADGPQWVRSTANVARFETLFVRGIGLRFRYWNEKGLLQTAIWQRGSTTKTWSLGTVAQETSLERALFVHRGVTDLTSQIVPSLLFGLALSTPEPGLLPGEPALAGSAPIGCGKCRVLAFRGTTGRQLLLVVDESSEVLRRFQDSFPYSSAGDDRRTRNVVADSLIVYEPELDVADESELTRELDSQPW